VGQTIEWTIKFKLFAIEFGPVGQMYKQFEISVGIEAITVVAD
jgi:hypothetical protein